MTVCSERVKEKGVGPGGGGGGSADTRDDAFLRYHCKLDTLRIFQSLIELCPTRAIEGREAQCICCW